MMHRLAIVSCLAFATTLMAADPHSPGRATATGPKITRKPNTYLLAALEAEQREQDRVAALIELFSASRPRLEVWMAREAAAGATERAIRQLAIELRQDQPLIQPKVMPKKIPVNTPDL